MGQTKKTHTGKTIDFNHTSVWWRAFHARGGKWSSPGAGAWEHPWASQGDRGWGGQNVVSEGIVAGDEVREVAGMGRGVVRGQVSLSRWTEHQWQFTRFLTNFRMLLWVLVQMFVLSMNKGSGYYLWLNPSPFPLSFTIYYFPCLLTLFTGAVLSLTEYSGPSDFRVFTKCCNFFLSGIRTKGNWLILDWDCSSQGSDIM